MQLRCVHLRSIQWLKAEINLLLVSQFEARTTENLEGTETIKSILRRKKPSLENHRDLSDFEFPKTPSLDSRSRLVGIRSPIWLASVMTVLSRMNRSRLRWKWNRVYCGKEWWFWTHVIFSREYAGYLHDDSQTMSLEVNLLPRATQMFGMICYAFPFYHVERRFDVLQLRLRVIVSKQ